MNAQKSPVLTMVENVMEGHMQKPTPQFVSSASTAKPVSSTANTAVKAPRKTTTKKVAAPKKAAIKPVNEPLNKVEVAAPVAKKTEPTVPPMTTSELIINFGKGAANAYSNSLTECFKPLAFLVNNGIMIMKGFSHLAMPLLMTYLLVTQIAFIQNMISQSGSQAIGFAYSVSFYFACALVWFTSWVALVGLGKAVRVACYKMALKGRTL